MKIVLDTNVLLDTILDRPGRMVATKLFLAMADDDIEPIVSANTITDLYYISRRGIGDEAAREAVASVLSVFGVAPVDGDTCAMALNTPMGDYEDAVLAVCAARAGADYIATSDQGFLRAESPVPAKTPGELLQIIAQK